MTKQADRWEREVARGFSSKVVRPQDLIEAHDAIKLLRKQHKWVERMVKELTRYDDYGEYDPEGPHGIAAMKHGRFINLDHLLAKLKERAR